MGKYIMSFDQGTTSSRCILFDKGGNIVSMAQKEFKQYYPKNGWVEHDAEEIWKTQLEVSVEAMKKADVKSSDISAIGITNQRETTVVWDKYTGKPVYNAIVWQCRRTSDYADELKKNGFTDMIAEKTGLVIDAYFSATKLKWILDNVEGAKEKAKKGDLLFGTIDTWLIWNLTGGKIHVTDYTNASRTMLFNIKTLKWDKDILSLLDIPENMLPEVKESSHIYGYTEKSLFGGEIPIGAAAGDQQAALFGQACFSQGEAKNTYGTGCFMLMNTGNKPVYSKNGLLTTIAWGINNEITYALEGSVFVAGALIQWLRDELKIIDSSAQSEQLAQSVEDTNGVYIVPAFTGLGAPYWDQYARGTIVGITRATTRSHIVRAALESIAYEVNDILKAMENDAGIDLKVLKVDGGASANNFLMQFQSDILGVNVDRPACIETTALGAAYLAGLAVGYYKSVDDINKNRRIDRIFTPEMDRISAQNKVKYFKKAVKSSLGWAAE